MHKQEGAHGLCRSALHGRCHGRNQRHHATCEPARVIHVRHQIGGRVLRCRVQQAPHQRRRHRRGREVPLRQFPEGRHSRNFYVRCVVRRLSVGRTAPVRWRTHATSATVDQ